ncbi:CubicO group peptidase, beta-lactamase class C family [Alteromonadaceae bacterium Bs31]|nr:CubicO group peptidase, beta-lactamase class C family [Alteromonadaceae bacterium Bs31]
MNIFVSTTQARKTLYPKGHKCLNFTTLTQCPFTLYMGIRKMHKHPLLSRLFLLCIFALSALAFAQDMPSSKPEKLGLSSERLQWLDKTFQAYVDQQHMSGSVVLAARKGKVFYHKAFGLRDREANAPMQPDTIFRIASQTKALVSVAAMILQERGQLHISDPVGKYIPEFMHTTVAREQTDGSYTVEKAKRPITLHDLLTHTSGVSYGYGPAKAEWQQANIQGWYFADRDEAILDIVKRMAALPFDAQPGEKWVYGYNTDILGAVLEVVSGMPLDELLNKLLIQPLDMRDTHFFLPEAKANRLASVYTPLTNGGIARSPEQGTMDAQGHYLHGPRKCFSGGAGLLSTAEDYGKFLQMLLGGGKYRDTRILSRKSVELMLSDHLGAIPYKPGSGFGLGFRIVKDLGLNAELSSVGTFRWGGAYHSSYWGDPEEALLVVYFTQLRPNTSIDDHTKLRALIYQAIVD